MVLGVSLSTEETTKDDDNSSAYQGESNDSQALADWLSVNGDLRHWLGGGLVIAGAQRHERSGYRQQDDLPRAGSLTTEPCQWVAEDADDDWDWNHGWYGLLVWVEMKKPGVLPGFVGG